MPAKKNTQSAEAKVPVRQAKTVKAPSKKTSKTAVKETVKSKPAAPAPKVVAPAAKVSAPAAKVRKVAAKTAKPAELKISAPETVQEPFVIPQAEIEMRAYFISERRQAMGWPGNSSTDWSEAEAQLLAEARRRLKKSL
ncbi:MAG: hypothetical protein WCG66_00905 [bacterium]